MTLWDSLASIFNMPNLKNFKGTFKVLSDNKIEVHNDNRVINAQNVVQVNLAQLRPTELEMLGKVIRESVQNENALIIEDDSEKLIEEFSSFDEKNKKELDYFRGKIPTTDLQILRSSMFLKSQHESGVPVFRLKDNIVRKYGERGRNIANLCSAGYYELMIKPLYEEMYSQPDFSQQKFTERYNVIVDQYPFAVFVGRGMKFDQLKIDVFEKIKLNKKYGIPSLSIHGIGSENVQKINDLLNDPDLKKEFSKIPEIDSGQMFITVKIWF